MDTKNDHVITISTSDMSKTNGGKFQGFGTSLCWWAHRIGYSNSLAKEAARLFYSPEGLGFNIMRYNIGGGDDPTHNHIERTDSDIPGWLKKNKANGKYEYDYNADKNQINVLKACYKAAGKDAYVEVFSNSPPYFMTESGCSSGAARASENNLKPKYYGNFAKYLATVSSYISKNLNIKVSSVSPMNEPDTEYWQAYSPKQEGCHVNPGKDQSEILVETAAAFSAARLPVEIVGSDETSTDKALSSYNAYTSEARSILDRISTHTYGTEKIEELGKLRKKKGFNLWMSEVDSGDISGDSAGEMGAALWISEKIISDINALSPSAWVMWQVIGQYISTEGRNGNKDAGMPDTCGGFWGAAVADLVMESVILTQKYYAIGQFSRYIRPGSTIITTGDPTTIAAYDTAGKKLIIVSVNSKKADKTFRFDLKGFTPKGSAKAIRTSGSLSEGESWKLVDAPVLSPEGFDYVMKGNSVTTFILEDVTAKK